MRAAGTCWVFPQVLCVLVLAVMPLRAVTGDADNSQDYAGFPRQPGFLITDFAEDNPAEADFPVSRPLPLDANHVESVPITGHRFIIRYQQASGSAPTVYQTQLYYEKLAAAAGFLLAKSGAVGDVSETFCRTMADHDIWVCVEPCNDITVITVVEAPRGTTPIPASDEAAPAPPAPSPVTPSAPVTEVTAPVTHTPLPTRVVSKPISPTAPPPAPPPVTHVAAAPAPPPVPAPIPAPAPAVEDANGEAIYTSLIGDGRIVVPFDFEEGTDTIEASSQPLVGRIVTMMKHHPDLYLRIEGHTDNTGDPDDNMRLSAERAIAVQGRIIAAGIDKKRLDSDGVGGLQPIADNSTAEGREKNRRIELVLWKRYSHRDTTPPATND